jgi:hypothetical protein
LKNASPAQIIGKLSLFAESDLVNSRLALAMHLLRGDARYEARLARRRPDFQKSQKLES